MRYDPEHHHRCTIRLAGYDYSQAGVYFVTLCTAGRECLFGEVDEGSIVLYTPGKIAAEEWLRSSFAL